MRWYVSCGCDRHGDHLGCDKSCNSLGCSFPIGVEITAIDEQSAEYVVGLSFEDLPDDMVNQSLDEEQLRLEKKIRKLKRKIERLDDYRR